MTDWHAPSTGDSYLWDRSGPVDEAVADLEQVLGILAFVATRRPIQLPRRRAWSRVAVAGMAAGLALAVAAGLFWWRLQWPADQAWDVRVTSWSGSARSAMLAVGQTLSLSPDTHAAVDIARLGTMRLTPGTELRLGATSSARHRLMLQRGTIHVSVWAPPGRVVVETAAGTIIDLGCVFTLAVGDDATASVRVQTGWVQLENALGETLIPAGASSVMSLNRRPLVPVYDDAPESFRQAVRILEGAERGDEAAAREAVTRDARARDVPTLLVLALRLPLGARQALLSRAAALFPPPTSGVDRAAMLDDAAVWRWHETLPLPPAKAWWRNWRDVFRR